MKNSTTVISIQFLLARVALVLAIQTVGRLADFDNCHRIRWVCVSFLWMEVLACIIIFFLLYSGIQKTRRSFCKDLWPDLPICQNIRGEWPAILRRLSRPTNRHWYLGCIIFFCRYNNHTWVRWFSTWRAFPSFCSPTINTWSRCVRLVVGYYHSRQKIVFTQLNNASREAPIETARAM